MTDQKPVTDATPPNIPAGFGMENEHPMLTMPFTVRFGGQVLEGKRISVTEIELSEDVSRQIGGAAGEVWSLIRALRRPDQGDGIGQSIRVDELRQAR